MGHPYRAVGWNRQKRLYDLSLVIGLLLFILVFTGIGAMRQPQLTVETLLIRALGLAAIVLLHLTLSIGPLARLDPRFLPLLYNRRHLGVTMFLVALAHGLFSIVQFHALGDLHPILSVLVSDGSYERGLASFPFQPLGLLALLPLFLMAATSHDFWLRNLGPPLWKRLHLGVYPAYFLVVMHVALGALQVERHPLPSLLLLGGALWIAGLHLAAWRAGRAPASAAREPGAEDPARVARGGTRGSERRKVADPASAGLVSAGAEAARSIASDPRHEGYVRLCRVDEIEEKRARSFDLGDERIALFRFDGKVAAVADACAHQNGPLGEGRIIDGCITCPWHGYQYRPEDGCSPPPFQERIATYRLRLVDGQVWVRPRANPPGTVEPPARIQDDLAEAMQAGRDEAGPAASREAPRS